MRGLGYEPVGPVATADEAADLFRESLPPVELAHELRAQRPLWADYNMVLTQLRNLLSNALKVAPPGSVVTLAARPIGEGIELTVADAGPGLGAARLAALAAPTNEPAPRQRSTGLGLPLVRQLAQRQRGDFWLASAPGRGTVVHLRLPWAAT